MIKWLLSLLLIIVKLFSVFTARCQDFPMLHYTVDNGLPSNIVYDIYRDSKGYLWFATDKGVARYDGIRFETFTTSDGLADNEVFFFKEDYQGRLWLATYNGELCYFKEGVFHTVVNTPFLKLPLKTPFINNIQIERDSSVTLYFFQQSVFVNIVKNKVNTYVVNFTSDKDFVNYISNVKKINEGEFDVRYDEVFVDSAKIHSRKINISRCYHKKYSFTHTGNDVYMSSVDSLVDVSDSLKSFRTYSFSQDVGYFYYGDSVFTNDGRFVVKFPKNFLKECRLNRIFFADSTAFMGTNHGLVINGVVAALKDDNVSSVNQDNCSNYWVSTLNNGVYYFDRHFVNANQYAGAYSGKINYVSVVNGHIFYANSDNFLYEFEGGVSRCLLNYKNTTQINKRFYPAYLLSNDYRYYNFFEGEYMVVDNVLAKNKKVKHYANLSCSGPKYMYEINKSLYVVDCRVRLFRSNNENTKLGADICEGFYNIITESNSTDRIFCMAKTKKNDLYYSTIKDVFKVINDSVVIQPQFKKLSFKYFDFIGDYLVGFTHNNQLVVCSRFDSDINIDFIPSQNCVWESFYQLDSCHLLLKTNNLYRILALKTEHGKMETAVWTVEDPFIPLHAEEICSDGTKCYFFNSGTITSFRNSDLISKPSPPKMLFEFLKTKNKSFIIGDNLELAYNESRNVSISFSTVSFGGKNISYQYSISKNDEDNWRDIVGQINLVNTGYGTYTIKLKAKTISSEYSVPIVFTLHILRPFWATWWFIGLCICGALGIIGGILRLRILSLLHQREKEHNTEIKFMKSEYKALNALMNPHFIFNTLNNVQSLVNENNKQAANEYLRVFADLIRQNMQNTLKELITLQKEMDLVKNYLLLEKLRFEDKLLYTINIEGDIDLSDIMVPPLLIQPLIENSIKHGILPLKSAQGFVHVNISERNDTLYIEVKDNGVGMANGSQKSDTMHESLGIDNIRKRIQQLSIIQNKHIAFNITETKDETGQQWTTVIITMPINE
jgi:two-component sensor histidine kinase